MEYPDTLVPRGWDSPCPANTYRLQNETFCKQCPDWKVTVPTDRLYKPGTELFADNVTFLDGANDADLQCVPTEICPVLDKLGDYRLNGQCLECSDAGMQQMILMGSAAGLIMLIGAGVFWKLAESWDDKYNSGHTLYCAPEYPINVYSSLK